ncbi:hypothetical protein FJR38_17535 [Anabaena sp. UHCC 0253]|uniref:COP23 domain-containing protein n=1 Tax=Anabaena sp. UHCC 0253 TaxID=2590019 RepID=UPI001445D528|nr:COP23 domain-containing protein [Anabaena sp. UHCC 0253]MTJ54327.1 hypothetical protein [Anabaena sp. UHCC 0253]
MLRKSLAILSGAVIVSSLGAAVSSPSYADPGGPFSCDTNSLTTVVGPGRHTVMRWRSPDFIAAGYTPLQRCLEVSDRFNNFHSTSQLNYITAGKVNGMPVICAASPGSSCNRNNVLFTLNRRNRMKVADILQTLFDNRAGYANAVVNESTDRVYIDVNKMLNQLGVNAAGSAQQPRVVNNSPNTTPSAAPRGNSW